MIRPPGRTERADRAWVLDLGLLAATFLCTAIYLVKGVGFVLDDWSFLRNVHFDGVLHAAGPTDGDRPVGALAYIALFGMVGPHPAAIMLVLAAGNGAAAVLFRRLLLPWAGTVPSALAAVLWVVLPLRMSLEAWMSTGTAVLAQLLALGGLLLVRGRSVPWPRLLAGGCLIAAGTLSYESVAVVALPVALALRWAAHRRAPLHEVALTCAPGALALAWAFTHRLPGRAAPGGLRSPLPVLDANFGWGVAPTDLLAVVAMSSALTGSLLLGRAWLRSPDRSGRVRQQAWVVGAGWCITLLGVAPYVAYYYSPYGAGDRLNALSAFGSTMVWAGLLSTLRARSLFAGATATLLVSGLAARVERADLWSRAGQDGPRLLAALVAGVPAPDRPIVFGPEPIVVGNVANLYSNLNADAFVDLAYDDRAVEGLLSPSVHDWDRLDPDDYIRFDQRPASHLDEATTADHPSNGGGL